MKRILFVILSALLMAVPSHAVLKEKDLKQTLSVLRGELMTYHQEQAKQLRMFKKQNEQVRRNMFSIMQRSNQNAMMLYSQKPDYVFDLTYACHEATNQYEEFRSKAIPLRTLSDQLCAEIERYDSLIVSLRSIARITLDDSTLIDRNVCLTLATNIRNTLVENQEQLGQYNKYYENTEYRLKTLNDYANLRYNEIQNNIFRNGGDNYFVILSRLGSNVNRTAMTVSEKYRPVKDQESQWDVRMIIGLFLSILFYGLLAAGLNFVVIRYLTPKRYRTESFLAKRSCITMATATITFAIILGIIQSTVKQNFIIMASNLLVEYAWLLGVILISLLLRVNATQIKSAFRIYTPLIVMGFIVISFRIILIPSELVNLLFPPILLLCTIWQWYVIHRHNENIPHSDMFYTYASLVVFIVSVACSWSGYTLLSVQILIWWIMQLTCILTITCFSGWMKSYAERHHLNEKPITSTWFYQFVYKVVLPILGLASVLISIYWAADVFNLSNMTWKIFTTRFIDAKKFSLSLFSISVVIGLWFLFSYLSTLLRELLHKYLLSRGFDSTASRSLVGRNVIQLVVWGAWLLICLSILRVSNTWLVVITGGLSTGVGFAMKDILENIYYGISLMAGRIKQGDWIEIDGTMGKVTNINYTSTMVESLYGEVIAYQNSQLFAKNYKNLTRNHGYVLALVPFGVAYGTDIEQVRTLVQNAVTSLHHKWMDNRKQVKVVFTEFADSSINMKLVVWVDAVKKIYVISEIMETIYRTLNEHGISIPFPQRDLNIKGIEELKGVMGVDGNDGNNGNDGNDGNNGNDGK
ncbi:MAG: mechanosensitive ion channel [Prevotella sp.]|nr:mechanosensitive ion channel [Prevotella sp.]